MPALPPALTCKLPGPWHDSQPMFFALSPFACNRACVAVRKSRTICSWQVAHSSEPTNSAPGIPGGAKTVRLVVLQDKRITATATSPPALHNKLSRLPSTHPASLERHTNGESAQKRDNYHHGFLWIFLPAGNDLVTFECDACAADPAETRLNIRANSCREIARRAD